MLKYIGGIFLGFTTCLVTTNFVAAETSNEPVELYGSVRLHLDTASVDAAAEGEDRRYLGARDAYSRIGLKGQYEFSKITLDAKLELGINTADLSLGDPSFFDDQYVRIASLNIASDHGVVTLGKDWLPYYNAVAYPVDVFSSVYAGFSTYAYFRENQLTYSSTFQEIDYSVAAIERTGGGPRGWQATASYALSNWTLSAGLEKMEGSTPDTSGASASWTHDDLYFAFKYEHNDRDGQIVNLLGQYTFNLSTLKLGYGSGDQYAGASWQLGADYQYHPNLKLFAEIYAEEQNYAILIDGAERSDEYLGASGFGARQNGKALALGFRFDF